jgi:hypothetical protein
MPAHTTNLAYSIALALGGRPNGTGWSCCCPAHADATPSLSVTERDGKVLVYCYAGCAQGAVIGALKARGLWGSEAQQSAQQPGPEPAETQKPEPPRDPLRSWARAVPVYFGSLPHLYLMSRAIALTAVEGSSLRFISDLWHWPSQSRWPAMIALVKLATGVEITCHQTFLSRDGAGKAPVEKPRLFPAGVSPLGGGVWFGTPDPAREFIVAEGLESLLSALRIFHVEAGCAALSALGIRCLILPPEAKRVRVFADHDAEGQGLAAAQDARRRWLGEGREVALSRAREIGWDANDVLMHRAGRI